MTVINKFVLMEQAKKVLKNAYFPYSKFPVGAAILFKPKSFIPLSTRCNLQNP
ncbi:cytidine deaminase [Streptococcus pneumoniae]|nr:cytidine deaminase [Streptococcus pneumoniae]